MEWKWSGWLLNSFVRHLRSSEGEEAALAHSYRDRKKMSPVAFYLLQWKANKVRHHLHVLHWEADTSPVVPPHPLHPLNWASCRLITPLHPHTASAIIIRISGLPPFPVLFNLLLRRRLGIASPRLAWLCLACNCVHSLTPSRRWFRC